MKFIKIYKLFFISFAFCACANGASYEKNYEFELAKSGNVDAQYNVAMNFLNGDEGFPKDYIKAKKWFELASNQGDPSAQNALGIMYLNGFGVEKNIDTSEYFYRLAANNNHENAQLQLALILLNKEGAKKEAIFWLEKASSHGNVEAQEKLIKLK